MKERYRVGIVGAGFGVKAHLPALLAHPRFEVVALASPHSAAAVAKERSIPHAFGSCAQMLAGCELDAVVVASPPFSHHGDTLAALALGKHVLCEKPFALNVAQAQDMVAAAKAAGTGCGVVHEFRWVPERIALQQMVANGHLSPMREIELTHLMPGRRASDLKPRGWMFERKAGGGICGALMSHAIDAANHLAGSSPVSVRGSLRIANPERTDERGTFISETDDGAFALLDYGDGLIARLATDATTHIEQFTFAVHGEKRTAVASGTSLVDMRLFAVEGDTTDELHVKPSPYARFENVLENVPLLMELYDEWIRQIETGVGAVPTFEEALATQRVLEHIGYSI
ncbi:MAG: Gfo/Idh/MocA family protein [Vulcanimicrobiaceae bacterium]